MSDTKFNYKEFFDASVDMMCIAGSDGYFKKVNWAFTKILGYTESELLSRPYTDFVDPEDFVATKDEADHIEQEQRGADYFLNRYICKDGSKRWFSWKSVKVGELIYAVARDITREKMIEADLIERKRSLRFVLENAPISLFSIDAAGVIKISSGKLLKSLGMTNNQNVGKNIFELYDESHPESMKVIREALSGKEMVSIHEIYGLTIENKYSPIFDQDGRVTGMIGVSVDVTDLKKAHDELQKISMDREKAAVSASQMKTAFLAKMSHEIRTPLTGIIGMTDLLRLTKLNSKQKEFLDALQDSGRAMLAMVDDVLDFSKIEAGKVRLEKVGFDLTDLGRDVARTFELMAKRKKIKFLAVIPNERLQVVGDPVRIRQILFNLLQNAFKFTEQGSVEFKVAIRKRGDAIDLQFSITDTGIGIDTLKVDSLFQPYRQADSTTARKFGGTGLGLSICKELIDLMKGEIEVRSALGEGSQFVVNLILPLSKDSMGTETVFNLTFDGKGRRVLVAEDHPVNQKLIHHLLQKFNLQVDIVSNGRDAVLAARKNKYDLIFMDCHMPGLDGFQATAELRSDAQSELKKMPIVALTADAVKGTREKCEAVGMDGYLQKPINISQLQKLLFYIFPKTNTDVFDQEYLVKLLRLDNVNSSGFVIDLVQTFLSSAPKRMGDLEEALKNEDADRIKMEAHAFKSSSACVGLKRFSQLCADIEKDGLKVARYKIPSLKSEFETALPLIESFCQKLKAG